MPVNEHARSGAASGSPDYAPTGRVVLVDDDAGVRRLVRLLLTSHVDGVRVVGEAPTAAAMLDLAPADRGGDRHQGV